MRRTVWSPRVRSDLLRLNLFYEGLSPGISLRFVQRIDLALAQLLDFPELGSMVPDSDARVWRARRVPYKIVYDISPDSIDVLAVHHECSDWRNNV